MIAHRLRKGLVEMFASMNHREQHSTEKKRTTDATGTSDVQH